MTRRITKEAAERGFVIEKQCYSHGQLLRADLQRAWIWLDQLPGGARVNDRFGQTWQQDARRIYWHSCQGDIASSFELAQSAPLTETS